MKYILEFFYFFFWITFLKKPAEKVSYLKVNKTQKNLFVQMFKIFLRLFSSFLLSFYKIRFKKVCNLEIERCLFFFFEECDELLSCLFKFLNFFVMALRCYTFLLNKTLSLISDWVVSLRQNKRFIFFLLTVFWKNNCKNGKSCLGSLTLFFVEFFIRSVSNFHLHIFS